MNLACDGTSDCPQDDSDEEDCRKSLLICYSCMAQTGLRWPCNNASPSGSFN